MERMAEEYHSYNVDELLLPHTLGRGFFFYPENRPPGPDRTYSTNSEFWNEVLGERAVAEHTVILRDFNTFEWIPRNPGLAISIGTCSSSQL
jgi:hypothetical protein